MDSPIEYAGGIGPSVLVSGERVRTRNAPAWWLRLADRGLRAAAAAKSDHPRPGRANAAPPAKPRWAGWIAGVACAGVSEPAYSPLDGLRLREQFTDAALAGMAKRNGRDVPLLWGHDGPTLCTTRDLDMLLRTCPLLGLLFTARLKDTASNRRVLQDIGEQNVIGVSIAFTGAKGWKVQRDAQGDIRIVNEATIDHIAIIPRDSGKTPCYPAAWAAASIGHRDLCPVSIIDKAKYQTYLTLKRQAGIRC